MENLRIRVKNWEKHQHYKKKNKNYNNEQPWFMVYGRRLLRDINFMQLEPYVRDFLLLCWCVGSQDNGFLPPLKEMAFWIRRDEEEVEDLIEILLKKGWLICVDFEEYEDIQNEQEEIIQENRIQKARDASGKKSFKNPRNSMGQIR